MLHGLVRFLSDILDLGYFAVYFYFMDYTSTLFVRCLLR